MASFLVAWCQPAHIIGSSGSTEDRERPRLNFTGVETNRSCGIQSRAETGIFVVLRPPEPKVGLLQQNFPL
ncbi:hypothetical protein DPEC_G00281300 [Dallia pectoralis]|uniref:Uncharacterized protein n=1 Tax=Dallia pectoralis TaxID=75939 RepID=A0ACC2FN85_DALPE|nr:hypothetical protein DPEC_G00281300 [Dallia pectoralis]